MQRLYSLHQDCEQRWRWFGASLESDSLLVSRRSWESRLEAGDALTRFLRLLSRSL